MAYITLNTLYAVFLYNICCFNKIHTATNSTVTVNHHTKFQANISIHDWIIITFFWNSKWRLSVISWITWFWAIGRLGLCFSIIVPNLVQVDRRRNYGPKSKSKMAAVRHLGFVTSSYRTTHEVYSLDYIGLNCLSNFMLHRCIVSKIWRFDFFANLAWNAYSRPQNFGFWGLNP